MQHDHYSTPFTEKKFPITIVCDNVNNAPNIGSLFRTAEAFGVEKIIFCGNDIPLGRRMTKTSRATEKVVHYEVCENIKDVISDLKKNDYHIISLEITNNSKSLDIFQFPKNKSIALVIGNENFGISDEILNASHETIHINMFGKNSSMNVVQATSITLYEITKQLL